MSEDKDRVNRERDRELAAVKAECTDKDRELEDAIGHIDRLITDCERKRKCDSSWKSFK